MPCTLGEDARSCRESRHGESQARLSCLGWVQLPSYRWRLSPDLRDAGEKVFQDGVCGHWSPEDVQSGDAFSGAQKDLGGCGEMVKEEAREANCGWAHGALGALHFRAGAYLWAA